MSAVVFHQMSVVGSAGSDALRPRDDRCAQDCVLAALGS